MFSSRTERKGEMEGGKETGGIKVCIFPLAGCYWNLKGCKACRGKDIRERNATGGSKKLS